MSDFEHLLPPNAAATERAIETVMADGTNGIDAPISKLWDADTCPVALLPWLAWALSVEVWDDAWSETIKRNVIRNSVQVHQMKGTRRSVELALEALEMRIDLHEGFELDEFGDPYGAPHTFTLDAFAEDVFEAGLRINPKLFALVDELVRNVKPVRTHFVLRIGEKRGGSVVMRTGSRQQIKDCRDVSPALPIDQHAPQLTMRTGSRQVAVSHHIHRLDTGVAA